MSLEFNLISSDKYCTYITDGTHGTHINQESGKYLLSAKDILDGVVHIKENSRVISEEDFNKIHKNYKLENYDVLLTVAGTIGRTAIIRNYKNNYTFQRSVAIFKTNDKLKSLWLYYYLNSPIGKQIVKSLSKGTTQLILPLKDLRNLEIPVPKNIEDQKKILSILVNIDKKIEVNKKINKNLEEQIETIYNSFFVYYDDFSKEELEECEIGLIPKDWELMSLGEVTTKIKEKVGSDDYKVFSAVNTGNLILSEEYFDKQVYSKNIEKYIVVKQKEFAYNPARINIGSIGRNDFNYDGCVSPVYVAFKVEEGYENFMNMYIKSNRFNQWVVTLSSGSVRQTLNYADFSIIKIAYPPKDLVNKFNKVYDNYYEVINYNNSVISNLENIRDTLLPKLMSGEIDVSKINCDLKIIIRKIYIKSSKLFLWRYLSENKNYIKNTKSNETLLKSRTIYQINKFLAKFNARYRYYRQ